MSFGKYGYDKVLRHGTLDQDIRCAYLIIDNKKITESKHDLL